MATWRAGEFVYSSGYLDMDLHRNFCIQNAHRKPKPLTYVTN